MTSSKPILLLTSTACFALIAAALYLQLMEHMLPCPLCIIQRYLFLAVGLICLITAFVPGSGAAIGAALGAVFALGGVGTAAWHIYIQANPEVSCGIDPLETSLNKIPPADWLPVLFKADGLCTTPYSPIFGLSIPQWSVIWFALFALTLGWIAFKRGR